MKPHDARLETLPVNLLHTCLIPAYPIPPSAIELVSVDGCIHQTALFPTAQPKMRTRPLD